MRRNAIVSLVFSLICLVFGVMLNIVGFRHALSPVSIQKYVGGFSMSMTVPGSMSFGFSSMSLMLIILGSSLLICAAIFYAVFVYARGSEKRYVARPRKHIELNRPQKRRAPVAQKEAPAPSDAPVQQAEAPVIEAESVGEDEHSTSSLADEPNEDSVKA